MSLEGPWDVLEGPGGGPWRSLRVPGGPWKSLAGPSGVSISPNALFSNESIGSLGVLVVSQEVPGGPWQFPWESQDHQMLCFPMNRRGPWKL